MSYQVAIDLPKESETSPEGRKPLRLTLLTLGLAGMLAIFATVQVVTLVQFVAREVQNFAYSSQAQAELRDLEYLANHIEIGRNLQGEEALNTLELQAGALNTLLQKLDENPVIDAVNLQMKVNGTVEAARVALRSPQDDAAQRSADIRQDQLASLLHQQISERAGGSKTSLSGLMGRVQTRIFVLVAVLGATIFLLMAVLLNGYRELQRRALVELDLRTAVRSAKASDQAKSQFLAAVTEEIRTPLNALIETSGKIEGNALTAEQQKQVEKLSDVGRDLTRIVDGVHDLSQIETGMMDFRAEPFSPHELVEEAIDLVSADACARGLVLSSEIGRDVPELLEGDSLRLSQVLLNLLNNAIKFTPDGFITLRLTSRKTPEGFAQLRVEIQDSGIGMTAKEQDRLFTNSAELANSLDGFGQHCGLGLPIAQGIIRQMGGKINVFSRLDEGTIFWFYLNMPVVKSVQSTSVPEEPADLNGLVEDVMVIGNMPEIEATLRQELTERRIEIHHVVDPGLALSKIVEVAPDVILCATKLPGSTGSETLRFIRALPKPFGDTPVIAVADSAMQVEIEEMMLAGINGFLTQPETAEDLIAAIRDVVANKAEESKAPALDALTVAERPEELAELVDLMGLDWALKFIERLSERLEFYFQSEVSKSDKTKMMHSIVSEAGQIGVRDLAWTAAKLEEGLRANSPTLKEEARFRNEAQKFLTRLPEFTEKLKHTP